MMGSVVGGERAAERTVLYIEDNPANLRLVEQLVSRIPRARMLSAHEPWLGIELAEAHRPNLILLDINLPGIDGYEVLRRLRASPALAATPVIAISANALPRDLERARAAGFDGYLTKPLKIDEFFATVDKVLGPSPGGEP